MSSQQISEGVFVKWDTRRRRFRRLLWILPLVYIFAVAYPLSLVYALSFDGPEAWEIVLIVLITIIYVTFFGLFWWRFAKRRLGELAQEACIYAATVAADELKNGNTLRASLSMEKLLLALSDLLRQRSVALGVSSVAPNEIMHVTPDTISKRAVFQAIQERGETEGFQDSLQELVTGLSSNKDAGYLEVNKFLIWLKRNTQVYQKESETFLDKHKTWRFVIQGLGPLVVPPIVLVIIEFVRRLIVAS